MNVKTQKFSLVAVAVFFLITLIVLTASAATTISTNISTGGTLSVTGLSTLLGGATTTSLTLLNGEIISNATDGVIQLGGIASTTSLTLLNGETITNATDGTIALTGALTVSGVSSFTGLATLLGGATTTSLTLLNGETITNATDGTITFGATNTVLVGTASSSAIRVGTDQVSVVSGIIFGFCTIADTAVAASSTAFADCTGATGVTSSYRVIIQATSSLPAAIVIQSASSTATTGTVNVRLLNTGLGTAVTTSGINSFNFWAVR